LRVWDGFSKIGGLIALFQISALLSIFHKYLYERSLQSFITNNNDGRNSIKSIGEDEKSLEDKQALVNYRERFSVESFSKMIDRVGKNEEEIRRTDVRIGIHE